MEREHVEQLELQYLKAAEEFVKNLEKRVGLPRLASAFRTDHDLLAAQARTGAPQGEAVWSAPQLTLVVERVLDYLNRRHGVGADVSPQDVVAGLEAETPSDKAPPATILEPSELQALKQLVQTVYDNNYNDLLRQQQELEDWKAKVPLLSKRIEEWTRMVSQTDSAVIQAYQQNEERIKQLDQQLKDLEREMQSLNQQISRYDVQINDEPDLRQETLNKLPALFEAISARLLERRRQNIEARLLEDFNEYLANYKGYIGRVSLQTSGREGLTMRVFHTSGNEISLTQLNTAGKQVVIQTLLKALHEFGDYDPPVMIDTVMGALDRESRRLMIERYFPQLAHQTLLLSSDSEITPTADLNVIRDHISRTYTLLRNQDKQYTAIQPGYFGHPLNA